MDRKSKGRQKINMVKIEKESNLQVTFSKRRSGIFKKASELSTLCGAELAILIFSPGNKAFSFGNPSFESILERFLSRHSRPVNGLVEQLVEAHRDANIRDLTNQLTHLEATVEAERRRGEILNLMNKDAEARFLPRTPVDELNLGQLDHLKSMMLALRSNVAKKIEQLKTETMNAQSPAVVPPSCDGVRGIPVHANARDSSGGSALLPDGFYHGCPGS